MGLTAAMRLPCTSQRRPVIGAPFVSMAQASSGAVAAVVRLVTPMTARQLGPRVGGAPRGLEWVRPPS